MAGNDARRQKKLMKKRQKDKLRRKKQARSMQFEIVSARKKILSARKFPIYECLVNPLWRDEGLATVLISRRQPDGNLVFGLFLVDIYCLGLKNTFCNADFSISRYETELLRKAYPKEKPVQCSIGLAHHIIYGGIAYAQQLGFRPNKDFRLSQYVLDDQDNFEPYEDIEFGKDGEPFFIAGPDDNVEYIMRQLESRVGEGNFKYLLRLTQ